MAVEDEVGLGYRFIDETVSLLVWLVATQEQVSTVVGQVVNREPTIKQRASPG